MFGRLMMIHVNKILIKIKISAILSLRLKEEREEVVETQLHKNRASLTNTIKIKRPKRGRKKVILVILTKKKESQGDLSFPKITSKIKQKYRAGIHKKNNRNR